MFLYLIVIVILLSIRYLNFNFMVILLRAKIFKWTQTCVNELIANNNYWFYKWKTLARYNKFVYANDMCSCWLVTNFVNEKRACLHSLTSVDVCRHPLGLRYSVRQMNCLTNGPMTAIEFRLALDKRKYEFCWYHSSLYQLNILYDLNSSKFCSNVEHCDSIQNRHCSYCAVDVQENGNSMIFNNFCEL